MTKLGENSSEFDGYWSDDEYMGKNKMKITED